MRAVCRPGRPPDTGGQWPGPVPLRVAHVLAALQPSGAERMLQCSFPLWQQQAVEPVVIGLSAGPHPFAPALRQAGYETVLLTRDGRSLRGLGALRGVLAEVRPDVVHVHNESMFPLVCALGSATAGVRGVVRSIHNNFDYRGLLAPRRILFSRVTAAMGVISVACGAEVADNEERRYRHRPRVVENWVDVAAFSRDSRRHGPAIRAQLGLAPDDFVVMLLGNCDPAKRHAMLLDAVSAVRCPVVILHVGGEERADQVERISWSRLPSRHRLIRLGRRADASHLLGAADVLAMPSAHEGFPLAAAEAFCAATPVIAAQAPGLRWVAQFRTGRGVPGVSAAWAAELAHAAARRRQPQWLLACRLDARDAARRFSPARGVADWRHIYALACWGTHPAARGSP